MSRNDFIITFILGLILLSGVTVESIRGANKTANVVITHPIESPFNSDPQHNQPNKSIQFNQPTAGILSVNENKSEKSVINFLNNASKEQLMQISGIGETYAQRIIDTRNDKPFENSNDVLKISGIGQAKWNSMVEFVKTKQTIKPTQSTQMPYRVPIVNKPIYQPYQQTQPQSKTNLNHAQKEDLLKIPGIGDVTANNFLKARHVRGNFQNWEQVKEISGIGEKRLADLKEKFYIP